MHTVDVVLIFVYKTIILTKLVSTTSLVHTQKAEPLMVIPAKACAIV